MSLDLGETFVVNEAELGGSYDTLPAGKYYAQAISAEIKDTKAGDGKVLTFTFEILDGQFEKRRIWERLNYINPNATTQEIARKSLGRFAHAIGLKAYSSADDFLFQPVIIDVGIRAGTNGYSDSNNVRRYISVDGDSNTSAPAPAAPAGAETRAATPPALRAATKASGASRPWDNAR